MGWLEEQQAIKDACAQFPGEFGLRGHAGIFRVSESASHFAFGEVQIYLQGLSQSGRWLDFAKGTVSELQREMVSLERKV